MCISTFLVPAGEAKSADDLIGRCVNLKENLHVQKSGMNRGAAGETLNKSV